MPPIISIYSCAFACAPLLFPEYPIHMTSTCKYLYGYLNSYSRYSQFIHIFSIFIACFFVYLFDVCTTADCGAPSVCMLYVRCTVHVHCLANTVRQFEYLFCMQCFIMYILCPLHVFAHHHDVDFGVSLLFFSSMSLLCPRSFWCTFIL